MDEQKLDAAPAAQAVAPADDKVVEALRELREAHRAVNRWHTAHAPGSVTPLELARRLEGACKAADVALASTAASQAGAQQRGALTDAAQVLVAFAKTAPGRLPSQVQAAIRAIEREQTEGSKP